MSGISPFRVTPRQAHEYIIDVFTAGLVPFLKSSPGMGKSAIYKSIAKEFNLELIDIRLSTCAPEDLTGLPHFENGKARFKPFDIFPLESDPLPEGKDGWLIFLDEFNSASKAVQAAAYKLLLDRMVGQEKLHHRVHMGAAGNLDTDRAITNNIGTALQSRLIHLEMHLTVHSQGTHSEFMEDVAFKYDWDERVIAFLSYMPDRLMDFRPDHNNSTFCCPRTWDYLQKMIKGKTFNYVNKNGEQFYNMDSKAALYAGTITAGVALEFINFTKVFTNLPKLSDIVGNPTNIAIPTDPAVRFAVVSMLISQTNPNNFSKICDYINRMNAEFRVLFFRGLVVRKPELREEPAFRKSMLELSRYLNE